ncbi:hypothetical protein BDP27DRAFT_1455742 [Rhodocollybia butyracea]|uniref:Uncharacterized protein n=1 Tax=Rhodocollybia butyracea TaxID=206335 RepID=A0A9P5TW92_9AGAR|nr:hypothetical protein BDP27DRAFT_1455742 [Rhodocollybia butyracea]
MSQLLDLLDRNPLLMVLSLEYCLPYLNSPVFPLPPPTRVGKLVRLADLTLAGRVLDCIQVLERLSIPATASLHISCNAWDRTEPSIRDGKEACDLIPLLTPQAQATFTKLSILPQGSLTHPGAINVSLEGVIQNSPIYWDLYLPVAFPSLWNYIQMLNAVFDALPCIMGVKDLSLMYCEFPYEVFIALFHKMQNVEILSISNISDHPLDSIAIALDSTITFDEGGTLRDSVFFPYLKDILIYDAERKRVVNDTYQRMYYVRVSEGYTPGRGERGVLGWSRAAEFKEGNVTGWVDCRG